jgi:hypothetical protein
MTKHSIALGDGLMTLAAEWVRGNMLVTLNDAIDQKHVISRILTHTFTEHGTGVFQDAVNITGTSQHSKFLDCQMLSTITSPRTYLIQVMCTVNSARRFYGLPPIVWEHVEDKRKVYLGGLEVTSNLEGQVRLNGVCINRLALPFSSAYLDDSADAYGTTGHVIRTLTYINEKRVEAGLRELVWEVV